MCKAGLNNAKPRMAEPIRATTRYVVQKATENLMLRDATKARELLSSPGVNLYMLAIFDKTMDGMKIMAEKARPSILRKVGILGRCPPCCSKRLLSGTNMISSRSTFAIPENTLAATLMLATLSGPIIKQLPRTVRRMPRIRYLGCRLACHST
jgi:hypothetical protein